MPSACGYSAIVKGLSTVTNSGQNLKDFCPRISDLDIHFVVDKPIVFLALLRVSSRCRYHDVSQAFPAWSASAKQNS